MPYGKNVSPEKIKNIINNEENIYKAKSFFPELDELFIKLLTINRYNRINFQDFFNLVDKLEKKKLKMKLITNILYLYQSNLWKIIIN